MKKFFKIFGITLILILAVLIIFPLFFKDKVADLAKTEIKKQVNANVEFGDFGLSIFRYFPNLNLTLEDLFVSGLNKFEGDTLLDVKEISVKVDLMSILGNQIEILGVHFSEPKVFAHVLPDASTNWDIAKESSNEEVEIEENAKSDSNLKFGIQDLSIKNAIIIYKDEQGDLLANLQNLDLKLSGDFTQSTANLDLELLIEALTIDIESVNYMNRTNVDYNAIIQADLENMKFDFLNNELYLNKLGLTLAGYFQMNENDSYGMDLSFNSTKNDFKDFLSLVPASFTKDLENVKTTGKLEFNGFAKGIYSENQLPAFNLNLNVDNANVQYPDLPSAINDIFINLNIKNKDGVDDHTVIDLKCFDLNMAGNPFSAKYIVKTPISDPYINGSVKGRIDFDKLQDAIPLDSMTLKGLVNLDVAMKGHLSSIEKEQYEQFGATGNIELTNFIYTSEDLDYNVLVESAQVQISPRQFNMPKFDAKVGKSDFHANGKIDNFLNYYFKDETLKGSFNFESALIDGNELAGSKPTEETQELADTTSIEVIELPKNIDLALNTKIDKIIYDTYKIDNFKGNVQLKEGVAKIQDVQMNTLGGTVKIKGAYDSRDLEAPKVDFGLDMSSLHIVETFKTFMTIQKLAPLAGNCQGLFDMKLNINTVLGQDMSPVLKTLNGDGLFESDNVLIAGSESLKNLSNILHADKYKELKVRDVFAQFEIKDGGLKILPVDIKVNQSKATFEGTQGLDKSIDYQLKLDIPHSDLPNADKLINDLKAKAGGLADNVDLGETIKAIVFITGTLEKPHFSIGTKNLAKGVATQLKEKAKEKITEVVDGVKTKVIEEAQKQADKLMEEANKQSEKLIEEAKKQADQIRKNGKKAADKVREESKKKIDKLVSKAGNNPIAKVAAKKAAEKAKEEAEAKANKIESEANKVADKLETETKEKTDSVKAKAKSEGDKLIEEAKTK